jgi:hypothetical protein
MPAMLELRSPSIIELSEKIKLPLVCIPFMVDSPLRNPDEWRF